MNAVGILPPQLTDEKFAAWAEDLRASVRGRDDAVRVERLIAGRQRVRRWHLPPLFRGTRARTKRPGRRAGVMSWGRDAWDDELNQLTEKARDLFGGASVCIATARAIEASKAETAKTREDDPDDPLAEHRVPPDVFKAALKREFRRLLQPH